MNSYITLCTVEQKVIYTTYKLYKEAKQWLQAKNDMLVMELGGKRCITCLLVELLCA
jgi:predicted adenine nucleotide alpha hydrolase (AANH) superfamily ATPase